VTYLATTVVIRYRVFLGVTIKETNERKNVTLYALSWIGKFSEVPIFTITVCLHSKEIFKNPTRK